MKREWKWAEVKRHEGACRAGALGGCEGPLELAHTIGREYDPPLDRPRGWRWVPPQAVVPLCAGHHRTGPVAYDAGTLDLTPYLHRSEELYAVQHLGLVRAVLKLSGERVLEDARVQLAERVATVEKDTEDLVPFGT